MDTRYARDFDFPVFPLAVPYKLGATSELEPPAKTSVQSADIKLLVTLPRSDGLGSAVADSERRVGALAVRIIITCIFVMLLAGCETKQQAPPATSAEREQARSALNACLQAAARKLDDGRSEASTVALALRPSCTADLPAHVIFMLAVLNPSRRARCITDG